MNTKSPELLARNHELTAKPRSPLPALKEKKARKKIRQSNAFLRVLGGPDSKYCITAGQE
jgi:hypothetical protein